MKRWKIVTSILLSLSIILLPFVAHAEAEEAEEQATKNETEDVETMQTELPEGINKIPAGIFYLKASEQTSVEPDYAVVELGVTTHEETYAEALSQLDVATKKLRTALEELDTDLKIEGQDVRVWEEIDYGQVEPKVLAFNAMQMYRVTVNDIEAIGDVLDAGIEAGSNESGEVKFGCSKKDEEITKLRAQALEAMNQKAEMLAETLSDGAKVQRLDVSYSDYFTNSDLRSLRSPMQNQMKAEAASVADEGVGGGGPVSPGLLNLKVEVNGSYFYGDVDFSEINNSENANVIIDGIGKASTKPDKFKVVFNKRTFSANSAEEAVDENDEVLTGIQAKLNEHGVKADQLQTASYNVGPQYSYYAETPELVGFVVDHQMELTLDADQDIPTIMNVLTTSDLTTITAAYYYLEDPAKISTELVTNATVKAYEEFNVLEQDDAKIIVINERPSRSPYQPSYYGGGFATPTIAYDFANADIPSLEFAQDVTCTFVTKAK